MIPRYNPTYQYCDLFRPLRQPAHAADHLVCAQLKELYNVKHIFTFGSARIALFTLLKAYNRPGDVLIPAYTCIVVPEAVEHSGYRPVFADIDCRTLNVTVETLTKALTPDTTVILATHLFGIPCNLEEVMSFGRKHNLLVVEDAAPAIGAEYNDRIVGSFGDAAVISFQATKVISSEDGGALITNDDELARRISRMLPTESPSTNRWFLFLKAIVRKVALNPTIFQVSQLALRIGRREAMYEIVSPQRDKAETFLKCCSPFTSALISVQFDRLNWNLDRRRKLAQIYSEALSNLIHIDLPVILQNSNPSWIQFPILVKDKGNFYRYMQEHGIDISWTYKYSCADSYGDDECWGAQNAAKTVLGLPTYPSLTDDQAYHICSVAKCYLASQ